MYEKPYIYAETAFHHEGDEDFMKSLIEATAASGADGIKFQVLLDIQSFLSSQHSGFNTINKWKFSEQQWLLFSETAAKNNLDIIWMPLDGQAVSLASRIKGLVKYIEVHSVSFYDEELHNAVKRTGVPVILGVGGRTFEEINWAKNFYGEQLKVLMTGFQAFPSAIEDVRLQRIPVYCRMFPGLTIGYADHTHYGDELAVTSNEYAYLLGASIFEKHITTREGEKRTDFEAAVSGEKISEITNRLNKVYGILNSHAELKNDAMTEPEIKYRNRQKIYVAAANVKEGTILSSEHIILKMIDKPGGIVKKEVLIGRRVTKDVMADELFQEAILK